MYLDILIPICLCASTYSCLTAGHATVEHFSRWRYNDYNGDTEHKNWLLNLIKFGSVSLAMYALTKQRI